MYYKELIIHTLKRTGLYESALILRADYRNLRPIKIKRRDLNANKLQYENLIKDLMYSRTKIKPISINQLSPKNKIKIDNGCDCHSLLDPLGSMLQYEQQILRGIYQKNIKFMIDLWNCGLLQLLADKRLIPKTKISDFYSDQYPIILEHQKVLYVDPNLWPYSMVKDAVLHIIIVNSLANKFGYRLIDGHLQNIGFLDGKPIFIDIGSFIKINEADASDNNAKEVIENGCFKLLLESLGACTLLNRLLTTGAGWTRTIPDIDVSKSREYISLVKKYRRYHWFHSTHLYCKLIKNIFIKQELKVEEVDLLFQPLKHAGQWKNYSDTLFSNWTQKHEISPDYEKRLRLVEKYSDSAQSCIDLAGNQGFVSYMIEKRTAIKQLISIDYDRSAVDLGYRRLKNLNSKVHMFAFNFMYLRGIDDKQIKVLQSDIVLAFAVTHHLLLGQNFRIDNILYCIKKFSKKYVFIEFCPLGLWAGGPKPDVPEWYTETWFEKNFKKHFILLEKQIIDRCNIMEENGTRGGLETHRICFVGKVK